MTPFDPRLADPLHPDDWFTDPLHVPDDPDPRVPSPWQRQRAMERERIAGRRLGCAVVLLAALFDLLVIAAIVVIAGAVGV